MNDSTNSADDPQHTLQDAPLPRQAPRAQRDIELVCGSCGHSFHALMAALADASVTLECPSCRKAFRINQRFQHDALEELDKRRRVDPVDQVLNDLGKILRN